MKYDWTARTVGEGHDRVELTVTEAGILKQFVENPGVVQTRSMFNRSFKHPTNLTNIIDVYVYFLRRKLGKSVIRTVRGKGYVYEG